LIPYNSLSLRLYKCPFKQYRSKVSYHSTYKYEWKGFEKITNGG
jgi:hypothetical protein